MSPKELQYIEDAIGHEKDLQTTCSDLSSQLQDPNLKTFVAGLANKHQDCFKQFLSLLN